MDMDMGHGHGHGEYATHPRCTGLPTLAMDLALPMYLALAVY
jgi:hypothetical protein